MHYKCSGGPKSYIFRPNDLLGCDLPVENKHSVDKSMGLRHFSTKVCEKVKEKGRTNYNQVSGCVL